MIYLDHAAATPLDARVLRAMEPYFTEQFFNPSSPYAPAIAVRRAYETAKDEIARSIGAKGDELIMTAGATESVNLAIGSVSGHCITASIEHQSVLSAIALHDHTIVSVTKYGMIDMAQLKAAIRPDTQLISVALANNEIGTIQPMREIAALIAGERRSRLASGNATPIYFHSDASQGLGLIDIHVSRLGVDMLTINAGKVYGPKQVGALWVSRGVVIAPQIVGGGQERGLRSGTENVAGTVGFAAAITHAVDRRKAEAERLQGIRDTMRGHITEAFPDVVVSGHPKYQLPNFLHVSFPGIDAERILFSLESQGVLVATGSACAANKGTRSKTLREIGLAPDVADGSLRITLGKLSSEDTCMEAVRIMSETLRVEYTRIVS